MADVYSNRLTGRLTNLATLLEKNGYRTESTMIRTLIGKVGNWKDGYEWNDTNALSTPDADYVLEEVVKTFTNTINEIARKKLLEKKKEEEESPEAEEPEGEESDSKSEAEAAIKELEKTLEGLF